MGHRFEQFTKEKTNYSVSGQKHFQQERQVTVAMKYPYRSSRMAKVCFCFVLFLRKKEFKKTGDAGHMLASTGDNWNRDMLLVGV